MHSITLLLEDHQHIRHLFAKLDNTFLGIQDEQTIVIRQALFEELKTQVLRHETMEQTFLYPFIRRQEHFKDILLNFVEKEKESMALFSQFNALQYDSKEWLQQYRHLQEAITQHIKKEEVLLFPKIESTISKKLLYNIGVQMLQFRNTSHKTKRHSI